MMNLCLIPLPFWTLGERLGFRWQDCDNRFLSSFVPRFRMWQLVYSLQRDLDTFCSLFSVDTRFEGFSWQSIDSDQFFRRTSDSFPFYAKGVA